MTKISFLLLLLVAAYVRGSNSCKQDYNLLGCYEEPRPGTMLFSDRHNIDWNNIVEYMKGMACRCGAEAKKQGYAGFAMHYYGECYGRTESQVNDLVSKQHKEYKCVGDQTYTKCVRGTHDHCTGLDFAEAVYSFRATAEENVNGGLGEWQQWTPCDQECGAGYRYRERNCDNPLPKGEGKDCSTLGPLSERAACKVKECPVDGGWSVYGPYGSCSRSCGGGVKTHSRTCTNPEPAFGGKECQGPSTESTSCNTNPCKINGGWSSFGSYGSCSKTCGGGVKYRFRTCTNPAPDHGGASCSGSNRQSASCNSHPCPVNGGWSSFGSYGSCSKRCGGGVKYRFRTCTNPAPAHGGASCSGSNRQSASCNSSPCIVNGGWSSFGSYGSCSKRCGGGVKYRFRSCTNPAPDHGGASCSGSNRQSASCNSQPCPVNGGWSSFTSYRSCSKICGGGVKYRYRTCTNPRPAHGGKTCPGSNRQSASCNTRKCPDIVSCSTKYTSYQTHSGGNMVYIDRHRMNCGGSGNILSMFHLQRSGGSMRYQYKCCKIRDAGYCSLSRKYSPFSSDGRGNTVYLDRHSANCGSSGFINDLRVERNSGHNKVRYNYYCCNLKSPWNTKSSCYYRYTGFTYDGNGRVYYLDRQTVQCNSGYALSYFRLQRNSRHDHWRYHYRCCKVRY